MKYLCVLKEPEGKNQVTKTIYENSIDVYYLLH